MSRALTESVLQRELAKHRSECERCQNHWQCDGPERIEAAFWDEVNRQIDDAKDRRADD